MRKIVPVDSPSFEGEFDFLISTSDNSECDDNFDKYVREKDLIQNYDSGQNDDSEEDVSRETRQTTQEELCSNSSEDEDHMTFTELRQ